MFYFFFFFHGLVILFHKESESKVLNFQVSVLSFHRLLYLCIPTDPCPILLTHEVAVTTWLFLSLSMTF